MRYLLAALLLCVGTFAQAASLTTPPSAEFIKEAERLAQWITENSDYGPLKKHPAYITVEPKTLLYIYYNDAPDGFVEGVNYADIGAIYLPHTMLLQTGFDLERDAYILLHELVHHFQMESGRAFACIGAQEAEAYALQNKYVEETGTGVKSDPLMTVFLTTCDRM